MATKKLVETIYGKSSKYEVYKEVGWASTTFKVYKNEKYWKKFSRLDDAVESINRDN